MNIVPTSRSIRENILRLGKATLFLPDFITMSDFLQRICIVDDYTQPDDDTRTLLLLQASNFDNFKTLKIERNFFTFIKNSSYILSFFTELAGEMVDISSLEIADTYAEYEEHLSILKTLYDKYKLLCIEQQIADPIFLPAFYKLNTNYISLIKDIELIVEGYLTNFEIKILTQCCQYSNIKLIITTTRFNTKMINKLKDFGFNLEPEYKYVLDFNNQEVISSTKIINNTNITCFTFEERISQVAFVKLKIYEYIKSGYLPHEIVVILPDESFASLLKLYNSENNFNFAMGEKFDTTSSYRHLEAICYYIEDANEENRARMLRYTSTFYEQIISFYYKNMKEIDFDVLMNNYISLQTSKIQRQILKEELYKFLKLKDIYNEYNLKSTLHLFLQRLKERTLDDVGGGKITVMGLLETRNITFKGVIVVDFNDVYVPKRIEKDLYLSSDIRAKAALVTQKDRQDLQRHYYALLFNRASHVNISCIKEIPPSRFLTQLNIPNKHIEDEKIFANILYKSSAIKDFIADEKIVLDYDFTKIKISASLLKIFLECKRRYYYKYILHVKDHEIAKDLPQGYEIGQILHDILNNIYSKSDSFNSVDKLQKILNQELNNLTVSSNFEKYQLKLWQERLKLFIKNEIKRFQDGYVVSKCEISLTCKYNDLTLIGRIDRIDKKNDELSILDYKSGKYSLYTSKTVKNATDFQLEFYYLLASQFGKNINMTAYYDLVKGLIIDEILLQEKLSLLDKHLAMIKKQKTFDFTKTDDLTRCKYCEYIYMCGRA